MAALATYYEDLVWGMSLDEVATSLAASRAELERTGASSLEQRRTINGVPVEVTFLFRDDGGLSNIEMSLMRSYAKWGDADDDEIAIVEWIKAKAGPFTSRDAARVKWELPTVKIWTYCDESLGIYFERP